MFDPHSPFTEPRDPLRPAQKADFALARLRAAILSCELAPGSIATEAEIATRFGLGRAALRSGLARLSATGLVQPIRRAGWKVLPITGTLIGEVIAARRLAEPGLAAAAPDAAALSRMSELAEMIAALAGQDDAPSRATRAGYERALLDLVARDAGRFVSRFLSELWDHSDRIVRFFEPRPGPPLPAPDARALVAAVAERDADRLSRLRGAEIDAFRDFAAARLLADDTELDARATRASRGPRARRPDTDDRTTDSDRPEEGDTT